MQRLKVASTLHLAPLVNVPTKQVSKTRIRTKILVHNVGVCEHSTIRPIEVSRSVTHKKYGVTTLTNGRRSATAG